MELSRYVRVFLKRGWIILLVAVITAASAVVFAKTQQVIYRSTAILQVIPARYDYGLTLAAEQLLRQFGNQIHTTARAQAIIDQLELDIPPDKLLAIVKVAPIPEDFLIEIEVDLPNPEDARDVANALAYDFAEYHATRTMDIDRRDRVEILVLEPAKYGWVHWPKTKTLALAGAIFGLLLGGILAFSLEYLESDVIRSSEDVERYVGVAVLGSIPTISAGEGSTNPARRRWWFGRRR